MNDVTNCSRINKECKFCGICKDHCSFLQEHGNPSEIINKITTEKQTELPFLCSLCGLCEEVCPKDIPVVDTMRNYRSEIISQRGSILKEHKPLKMYETFHRSSIAHYSDISEDTTAIFFPGCNLSSSRPHLTRKVYKDLKKEHNNLSIVLDCCSKPSYDMGDYKSFNKGLNKLLDELKQSNVKTIYTACPNCFKVFKESFDYSIKSIFEILPTEELSLTENYILHDPCVMRDEEEIHNLVRTKITDMGISYSEKNHSRARASCCGEGGAVSFLKKEYTDQWTKIIKDESNGKPVITYCAGCTGFLQKEMTSVHLLDLTYSNTKKGKAKYYRAPLTYFMKLRLIFTLWLQKIFTK